MRIIALEEHIATQHFRDKLGARPRNASMMRRQQEHGHDVITELMNIGESRIKFMDEAGISLQVLSLTMPGVQAFPADVAVPMARETNDLIADAIKKHPTRFAGFASLATCAPAEAVEELERCVTKLGFKGTMINGHAQGEYLDDKKYWGIFECAQALDVPIYLHPREPHPAVNKAYFENYPELQTAAWGFAMETCTHFLRLVFAGVFDAYPRLKFILGHMGEGLPFWLNRFEDHTRFAMQARGLKRGPRQYLTENLVITCSGNFSTGAFLCSLLELGIDNILFSVDWPYESNKVGVNFLNNLPLSAADKEKFAHGNAERLLKL
jgi:predicted TIM-barrel fold metal-dependent hydrolase